MLFNTEEFIVAAVVVLGVEEDLWKNDNRERRNMCRVLVFGLQKRGGGRFCFKRIKEKKDFEKWLETEEGGKEKNISNWIFNSEVDE